MATFRIDHLHIVCKNLEGMVRFWTSGIGASFKEYRSFGSADGAVLDLDGFLIYLRVPTESEVAIPEASLGYDHLGLGVDDLDSACEQLAAYGSHIISGPIERGNKKIAFLSGPENITLELIELI